MTRSPRRVVAYVLVFLGAFALLFAAADRFYAYPRLAKVPLGQKNLGPTAPVSEGVGTYFSAGQVSERRNVPLRSIRTVVGDAKAGSETTAVWDTWQTLVAADTGETISATKERFPFDRVTGQAKQCCGDTKHQGLFLKFPFGTRKTTYQYWDGATQRTWPMTYTRTETVAGLSTYRFEQHVREAKTGSLDLPGSLAGQPGVNSVPVDRIYSVDRTVWVEPRSGVNVKGQEQLRQTFRTADGRDVITALEGQITNNDATVRRQADVAKDARDKLTLLASTLPIVAALLGLILLAAGLLLGRRRPPGADTAAPARPAPRPAEPARRPAATTTATVPATGDR